MANADGSLRGKKTKAALARELEKKNSPAEAITTPSTCIIDGMCLVQRMNSNNKTFAQLVESVLSMVLYVGGQSGRVDVVFGVCRQPSIKDSETEVQAQPSAQMRDRGTQHTTGEQMPLQFLQQDGPHQVIGWRVETTAIQRYTASQGIVCNLRITLFQDDNTTRMRGRGGAAVHTRRRRHPFAFACAACCKKWFEYSHSPSRRYICHVALLCFPK